MSARRASSRHHFIKLSRDSHLIWAQRELSFDSVLWHEAGDGVVTVALLVVCVVTVCCCCVCSGLLSKSKTAVEKAGVRL